MLGSIVDVIPLWFCAEYAKPGGVTYLDTLRATWQVLILLWFKLTGSDPIWLEALNAATVAGLLIATDRWAVRSVLAGLFCLQLLAFARRMEDVRRAAALRSMVLALAGVYEVVQSRLWVIECGPEQGVPLLAMGVLSLTASRSVWRGRGKA